MSALGNRRARSSVFFCMPFPLILGILSTAIVLYVAASLTGGVTIESWTTLLLTAALLDGSSLILGPALSLLPQAIVAGFWASVVINAATTTMVLLVASVIFDDFEFGNPFAFVLMLVMMVAVDIALRYLLSQTITVG